MLATASPRPPSPPRTPWWLLRERCFYLPLRGVSTAVHVMPCLCDSSSFSGIDDHAASAVFKNVIPFSKPFFPELRLIIAGMLGRKDLLNYSVVCKEFNAEVTHLVWSGLTLPIYNTKKIRFEDICRAITRMPQRGKYVKGLSLQFVPFGYDISNEALNSLTDAFRDVLRLIPNARSLKILSLAATNGFPGLQRPEGRMTNQLSSQLKDSAAFGERIFAHIAFWMRKVQPTSFKSVYVPFYLLTPLFVACPSLSQVCIRLPYEGYYDPRNILPPSSLPHLKQLETSVYLAPTFLCDGRPITTFTLYPLHLGASAASSGLSRSLREANTIRILHTVNAPTFTLVDLMFFLQPVPSSLSVITEQERGLGERGPHYDDGWFGELVKILEIVTSLDTYVVRCVKFSTEDWDTDSDCNAEEYLRLLQVHVPPGKFPTFTRVILELGALGSDPWICWVFERTCAYHGDWEARRDHTRHLTLASREADMYLRSR